MKPFGGLGIKLKGKKTSIRAELILALLASVGIAGGCIFFLCILMLLASFSMEFAIFFNEHVLWFVLLFILIFAGLTLLFFVIFLKKKITYMETITESLVRIAEGNFDVNLPSDTEDELGKMAQTVNDMALRLKNSLEEERRQEQVKNDLITNLSHDLRTPLTSVMGYLELLRNLTEQNNKGNPHHEPQDMPNEDQTPGIIQELSRYLEPAYQQCTSLKVLIEELFEYTKLSNRELKLNLATFSVGELVSQTLTDFLPELEKAGLKLRLKLPDQRYCVEADPQQIKRVFDNLISNAIRYGSSGGYIDVELTSERCVIYENAGSNIDVVEDCCDDESIVAVNFINYGEPIPEQELPHIFERFYRGDKSRARPADSSGLGLAIAESIIKIHGGSIIASSSEECTVFTIRLKSCSK